MNVDSYIKYYEGIVPESLCNDLIGHDFSYKPSAYSTHDSGAIVKKERVSIVWANSLTGGIWEMQYIPGQIPARDERVPHVVPSAFR
jgi:hypothetical protein